jgi:hypothetical protein
LEYAFLRIAGTAAFFVSLWRHNPMLLNIDLKSLQTQKRQPKTLQAFGKVEIDLQKVLYANLDRLFRDEELLPIMQSQKFQEEPDVMALDKEANLFIFELKAWEASHSNVLQVLRYAQIFGKANYDDLNAIFEKHSKEGKQLEAVHGSRFDCVVPQKDYNKDQTLVIVVNGLDFRTREAIRYWRSRGLDIRPWIYRIYKDELDESRMILEMSCFSVNDNPYEDLASDYYIVNTNSKDGPQDHDDMINNRKVAAYFDPWKRKIERLSAGDKVFLYQSGVGIVAMGVASGKLQKANYRGNPSHPDEEYWRSLGKFIQVDPPISASEIKSITDVDYVFRSTMFGLGAEEGQSLETEATKRGK